VERIEVKEKYMSQGRKVKAAVCYEVGKPLVMDEVIVEPPGKGEVTIRGPLHLSVTAISI
jgi:hypothetical protein